MTVVAVIGAGAAGLVASRHLMRCGLQPCIFESSASRLQGLGGAWNAASDSNKMWDNLTPNLSKYTCCFSEALWPEESPTFPSRKDMHLYLEKYATLFVDPQCFRYGCTVTNVKRKNSNDNQQRYQVEWAEQDGVFRTEDFDGVIVATGFFSAPVIPQGLLPLMNNEEPPATSRVIHSSQYRSPSDFCNQTVAVCGASFSALEIAADVKKQAKKVINILPRIPWVMPRYVQIPPETPSKDNGSSKGSISDRFVPLDVALYRRSRDAPQTPATVVMDKTACRQRQEFLKVLSGSRKQPQSPLGITSDMSSPPIVAISDDYLNLVIGGNIDIVKGRVAQVSVVVESNDEDKCVDERLNIELEDGELLKGIDRIISCTGYRSQLNFLEPDILSTLEYNEMDGYAPLTLCYDTFHPKLPGIGFVGMYKGPYFGIMELQARLMAGLLSGKLAPSDDVISQALDDSHSIRLSSNRAQFPRFDYIGMMDTLAEQVNLVPSKAYGAKGMMVSPAFYEDSHETARRIKAELAALQDDSGKSDGSANMAKIALSALIGKWRFQRTITQFSSKDPPQSVTGQIAFSFMQPSMHFQEWNTVLYDENGIFTLPGGKEMEVFRQYEYEYKDDGILEIYFVEFGKRAHLFLSLKFAMRENGYWVATNDHLCIKDLYSATFKIKFDGIGASEVIMAYRVRGPNKDYESVTNLRPL